MTNEKILTIDDDEAIRNSFYIYLSDCGYQALTADGGAEGLDLFKKEDPDLVLIDLLMPDVDGFEVIVQIKEMSPETPLVVVSGVGEIDSAIKAIRLGAWDYLTKPVEDLPSLRHVIEKALERARLIKENREYREQLEEKVKSRTKELSKANKNLTQINHRLRQIVETTRNLSTCDSVKEFTQRFINELAHHMQAEGGSFYLTHENGLQLLHALDPGHASQFIQFPLQDNSVFDRVFKTNVSLLVEDFSKETQLIPSNWGKYRSKSALVFPLIDESQFVIGVFSLHDRISPPFSSQDKEIGTILASFCCESLRAVRASEEVSESEKRLGLAIHGADLGTWDWSVNDGTVMVNELWGKITGYQIDDFDQKRSTWEKMIWSEDLPVVRKTMNDHLNGQSNAYESEYRIKHKSGKLIWILDKGKVLERDESGTPTRVCGTYLDITARKQPE